MFLTKNESFPSQKFVFWPSLVGNILEFYDLGLYGFYAPVLYEQFFPSSDQVTSLLASFGIFAAGFIMRPLGALLFGYVGDIYGRKIVLQTTLYLTALSSLCIVFMPTYALIGLWASFFLTFFRLIQGLCTGGEYNTSAIFILEHVPSLRKGCWSGFITASAILGFFLSNLMAHATSLSFMPSWFWRVAFLFGGVAAFAGYKIRRLSFESSDFLVVDHRQKKEIPLFRSLKTHKKALISTLGVGSLGGVLSLFLVGFLGLYLKGFLSLPESQVVLFTHVCLLMYMGFLIFFGFLSDYFGYRRVMGLFALATLWLGIPLFFLLSSDSFYLISCGIALLALLAGGFLGPMHAYMFYMFPPDQRCSSISFCFSLGVSVFGGTSPMFSAFLINKTQLIYSPAFYLMAIALLGLFSLFLPLKHNFEALFPKSPMLKRS